jgi:AcrR family transcriptional regulator
MSTRASRGRRRERLPRAERVAAIMRVAREVFCDKGYAQASTAEIAARVGVVEGTLYRYFPSKRHLLLGVIEAFYERIFADYEQQLQGVRGTWNRLRFLIWKHLSVLHGDPAMCRLIVHELRPSPQYRQSSVYKLNQLYTQRTLAIVKEGIACGEFEALVPLRIVRDMIFGCAEHHSWAYLRGEGQFSPDDAADAITNLIYRGLARAGADKAATVAGSVHRLERAVQRLEGMSTPRRRQRRGAAKC